MVSLNLTPEELERYETLSLRVCSPNYCHLHFAIGITRKFCLEKLPILKKIKMTDISEGAGLYGGRRVVPEVSESGHCGEHGEGE